jgi:L-amino acid N-acyltransferase YncA
MLIRSVEPEDADAIWWIFSQIVQEGNAFLSDEVVDRAEIWASWSSHKSVAYVADENDEVVGAYLLKSNAHGRGSHIANGTYMVHPHWRGRGIGRALGEHSLTVARQLGYIAIQFNHVVSTNHTAVHLWQELGFAIVGTVSQGFRLPSGDLVDVYIMHRYI